MKKEDAENMLATEDRIIAYLTKEREHYLSRVKESTEQLNYAKKRRAFALKELLEFT